MITEDYVSFELAKLLKEKGFDEEVHAWHNCFDTHAVEFNLGEAPWCMIKAPTLQMAMKWLKEVHNIFISISITYIVGYKKPTYLWIPCVIKQDYIDYPTMEEYIADSYEEAAEAAIKYCLINLI